MDKCCLDKWFLESPPNPLTMDGISWCLPGEHLGGGLEAYEATNQEGCIISPNDIPTPPPSSPICSPIETCHEEVEEDQLYQLDHHFWVCVCVCVCMCDLKECLYLYTSREDPCGRPQSFDTDSHIPPKMKYNYTKIVLQWKNYIFYK